MGQYTRGIARAEASQLRPGLSPGSGIQAIKMTAGTFLPCSAMVTAKPQYFLMDTSGVVAQLSLV
jgi:hypothetical protein